MNTVQDNFVRLMKYIGTTYDSNYGVGEHEVYFPQISEEVEDAWFVCPHCLEPIFFSDFAEEIDYDEPRCPICEDELEF